MAAIRNYEAGVNDRWNYAPEKYREQAPWLLTKAQVTDGVRRGMSLIRHGVVPSPYSSLRFWKEFENPGHLKMHEHILMLGPLSKYLLQGMLGIEQQKALFKYIDALGILWCRVQEKDKLQDQVDGVCSALAAMEAAFPAWELNLNRHSILHIAEACMVTGPTPTFTTFFFERLWGRLGRWLMQKVHPEATMMTSYKTYMGIAHWAATSGNTGEKSPFSATQFLQKDAKTLERQSDTVLLPGFLDTSGESEVSNLPLLQSIERTCFLN